MGLTNFRASDFEGTAPVKNMVRSKKDRLAGPVETTKPLPQETADPNAVPAGTVPEVMTWVGDDKDRAQKALDVELANDRPRKGLVSSLTELVEAKPEPEVEEEEADADAEEAPAEDSDKN